MASDEYGARTHPYIMRPTCQFPLAYWVDEQKKLVLSPFHQLIEADWFDEEQQWVGRQPLADDFDLIDDF